MSTDVAATVTRNDDENRYEVRRDERLLGFAAYQATPGLVVFTHTEVFPGSQGQGVGSTLVQGALDDVRERGLRVMPVCPFVQAWIQRHDDYADLDHRAPRTTATR